MILFLQQVMVFQLVNLLYFVELLQVNLSLLEPPAKLSLVTPRVRPGGLGSEQKLEVRPQETLLL